jgi:hypothetical protein
MPSIPPTRSHLTHALFRARPGLDAFVEDHILKMTSDLAALNPIRLDELTFYGSAAHDTDEPRHEDVDLLDDLLLWLLGAIVLCERGELRARYRVRQQGTRRESVAIILSLADDEEAR